ncbi:hypothetical protein AB4043_16190 [Terriglobus sp. YAF25]|uniref:hypothetical protein n=1 Tax=Terriglobus sp. YAF25 TaxID=3233080 RepID=UPI003F9D623C
MAKAETAEMTPAVPVAKVGIVQLAMVAFVAVIGAVGAAGGLVWWMGKTGKLGGGGTKIVEVVKTEPQKTKDQVLEPMVVAGCRGTGCADRRPGAQELRGTAAA